MTFQMIVERSLVIAAGVIVFATLVEKIFGVTVIGKKIFKGTPTAWKWVMRAAIFRSDMTKRLEGIKYDLDYNGGGSIKDMVRTLVESDKIKTGLLNNLNSSINQCLLRLDISDTMSESMIFHMDGRGACTFINEAFLKTFGYTWRDMQGFNWESIIHDSDIDDVRERWARAIATKSRYSGIQKIVCSNRALKKVCVVGYPIIEGDVLKGYYGTVELIKEN